MNDDEEIHFSAISSFSLSTRIMFWADDLKMNMARKFNFWKWGSGIREFSITELQLNDDILKEMIEAK